MTVLNDADDLKVGDQQVDAVYAGSELVWSSALDVPTYAVLFPNSLDPATNVYPLGEFRVTGTGPFVVYCHPDLAAPEYTNTTVGKLFAPSTQLSYTISDSGANAIFNNDRTATPSGVVNQNFEGEVSRSVVAASSEFVVWEDRSGLLFRSWGVTFSSANDGTATTLTQYTARFNDVDKRDDTILGSDYWEVGARYLLIYRDGLTHEVVPESVVVYVAGQYTVGFEAATCPNLSGYSPNEVIWFFKLPPATPPTSVQHLALPGESGAVASVPDAPDLDLTGDMTLRMRIRKPDWTPTNFSGGEWFLGKNDNSPEMGWYWALRDTGFAIFGFSANGTAGGTQTTDVPTAPATDTWLWIQLKVVTSNRAVTWSTHPDQEAEPTSGWTEIAASPTGADTGSLNNSTADLVIGSNESRTFRNMEGDIRQLVLRDDELDDVVFTLDPDNWTAGTTWVTESGHTVTLEGTATIESEES